MNAKKMAKYFLSIYLLDTVTPALEKKGQRDIFSSLS